MRVVVDQVSWDAGGRRIVDGTSLVCEPGTVTGLLGPNGSGKTSLLHVLAGLRTPAAGTVHADGQDLHAMTARTRSRLVAVLEQQASTHLELSVREVVELGRIPHRGRWAGHGGEGADAIESAMRIARITELADRRWQTLSGGERQRTQLARALAQEPALLVLDEPTNHLDLGHQIDFLTTVRGLGTTTIAALHDLDLAAAFCDRLVVMRGGRIVAQGPVEEVLTSGLVADVYGVTASIERHEAAQRLQVVWQR